MAAPTAPYNTIALNGFTYKATNYIDAEIPYFATQRREGLPTFTNYVPEVATLWDSWHLGYGQLYYEDTPTYYTANGLDASIQRQITLALAAASTGRTDGGSMEPIQQYIEFQQTQYAVGSTGIYRWAPASSPNGWSLVGSFANQQFGQATVYSVASIGAVGSIPSGQYLIVPAASWQNFLGGAGSAWVNVATSCTHVATIRNEMWKAFYDTAGNWQVVKTVDGLTYPNANNISTLADTGAATINELITYDNRLFVHSTNGLITLDSGGVVYDVSSELGKYEDNRALKGSDVFHGLLYLPSDFGSIQYTGSVVLNPQTERTISSVGPDVKSWTQSEVRGHFRAFAADVNYLYATLNSDAGNGYVLKFRDYPDAAPGQGWHPIITFSGNFVLGAKISQMPWYGKPYPILWISAGNKTYMVNLPTENDNPLTNTGVLYQTHGTLDLPILDDAMPTLLKDYVRYVVEFVCPSSTNIQMLSSINGGTFNNVGGVISATSGTLEFDYATVGALGTKVQPRLQLTASSTGPTSTVSPYVRSIVLHHLIRPVQREQWDLDLIAENHVTPADNTTAHDKIRNLRKARNTAAPVLFFDLFNEGHQVTVENLSVRQSDRKEGSGPGFVAHVQLKSYALTHYFTQSAYTQVSFTTDPGAP